MTKISIFNRHTKKNKNKTALKQTYSIFTHDGTMLQQNLRTKLIRGGGGVGVRGGFPATQRDCSAAPSLSRGLRSFLSMDLTVHCVTAVLQPALMCYRRNPFDFYLFIFFKKKVLRFEWTPVLMCILATAEREHVCNVQKTCSQTCGRCAWKSNSSWMREVRIRSLLRLAEAHSSI